MKGNSDIGPYVCNIQQIQGSKTRERLFYKERLVWIQIFVVCKSSTLSALSRQSPLCLISTTVGTNIGFRYLGWVLVKQYHIPVDSWFE